MSGFASTATRRADHLAVVYETESLTYAELDERAARLARALTALGAAAGEPIGIMLPNCIEFIECLAACAKVRCPPLTVNWHLRPDELAWVLTDSGARVLVAHSDLQDVVEAALAAAPGEFDLPVLWVGEDYEAALEGAGDEPWPYSWPTSWPLIYTSGTSGRPKGVIHGDTASPETMAMAQDALVAMWDYRPDDVHLVAGPLYHAAPVGYANATLYVGGTIVLMERWDPVDAFRLIETRRVTTTFMTPAHFIRLLEVSEAVRSRFDFTSLRHVLHGGAPCPVELKERIMALLPQSDIWELYGMSEGGATRAGPDEWKEHPGTVGKPWPGVEITIRHPDTLVPLPAGSDGLVYIRPAIGRFRYLHDDDKTAAAWNGDSFTVGDVGHLDADGYLYLTDRQVDMVIRNGVNVYPQAVEEVLHRHPSVVDCAVFGVPDAREGEHLRAVVELRAATPVIELVDWCRERLDPIACPTEVDVVDELPRDPNGKVLKRFLRDAVWSDSGRSI